ncbi:MAG TPA: Gldg family protein [Gemmatimonadales bacterium]|jgi:ABC-2 type transport system permease protein|nr:Gldg family protein [Gemmatimonadales bacterium]
MKAAWTIAGRELKGMFDHPTGYILLVVFIGVNDFLFFRQAYVMHAASMRPMLDLLPWVFLFFVPAVTMRALAEESRSGTLEIVLAQPINEAELLAGKYVGQVLFLWLALALTLPISLGLSLGADLEAGVVVAQYAGAALLGLGFAGVGVWASSLSRNQITAFIVSVAVMFVLVLVGLDPLLVGLPPVLSAIAAQLGVLSHFQNIARGVIDLRDAIYFVTLAAIFLSLAYLALMSRKLAPRGETLKRLRLGVALLVAALVVVNLFGRRIGGRLDLTPGNAYTLSRATKQLAGNLPDLVTIKVFLSEELPAEIALTQRDMRDVLGDYRSAGKGKIRVVYGDPASDSTAREDARNLGIPSVQFNVVGRSELQVKEGYLGIALQHAGQTRTIPFVQRTDDLEYRLSSFIRALTVTDRPKVALATPAENPQIGSSFQALREALEENYQVQSLFLGPDSLRLDSVRVLAFAGSPDSLSAVQRQQIAEFLAAGGNALIMAGGMELPERTPFATARRVAWNDVLEPYGVSVRSDMVYDLASNERVAMPTQFGMRVLVQYPYWVRALSTHRSAINQEADGIFLPWSSSLDTSGARLGTLTPLFVTSRAAGVSVGQAFLEPTQQFPTDSLSERIMGVQVNPLATDSASGPRGRVVVIGSSDFTSDRNTQNAPENLAVALNAVDWLAQDESLISIRAKVRTPPPLVFSSTTLRDGVKYANVFGVPVLLIVAAAVHLGRRRRLSKRPYRPVEAAGAAAAPEPSERPV